MSGARWLGWPFPHAGGFAPISSGAPHPITRVSRLSPHPSHQTRNPSHLSPSPRPPRAAAPLPLPFVRVLGQGRRRHPRLLLQHLAFFSSSPSHRSRACRCRRRTGQCGSLSPFPSAGSKACGRGGEPLRWRRQRATAWIVPCRREKMGERERRKERREARWRTGEGHRPAPARSGAT